MLELGAILNLVLQMVYLDDEVLLVLRMNMQWFLMHDVLLSIVDHWYAEVLLLSAICLMRKFNVWNMGAIVDATDDAVVKGTQCTRHCLILEDVACQWLLALRLFLDITNRIYVANISVALLSTVVSWVLLIAIQVLWVRDHLLVRYVGDGDVLIWPVLHLLWHHQIATCGQTSISEMLVRLLRLWISLSFAEAVYWVRRNCSSRNICCIHEGVILLIAILHVFLDVDNVVRSHLDIIPRRFAGLSRNWSWRWLRNSSWVTFTWFSVAAAA